MKNIRNRLFLALAILLLAATSEAVAGVIVVSFGRFPSAETAGRAEAQVNWNDALAADGIACTQCFAALELQHYLRKMTGRAQDFAILSDTATAEGELILIGGPTTNAASRQLAEALRVTPEQLAALGPEGYRIKSGTDAGRRVLLIAGGGRVGTLYGTYDLLYRLGCRWFAPGEIHEEAPQIQRMGEFDVTEQPAFFSRGFLAWENRGNPDFLLWMARNRLNLWCVEQDNHPLLHKLGIQMAAGLHDSQELFFHPSAPYPYDYPLFSGNKGKPKDPYLTSEESQGDENNDGKLTYFEAHPEWYPLFGGRRVPGIRDDQHGTNYCTSNPDATTEYVKNYVQALIDGRYRDADIVRFMMLDNSAFGWCECDECKALGTPTDRNIKLVYRLDQEIKRARAADKIRRPIQIRFLVYNRNLLDPPSRPLPADFDYRTCLASFWPIARCYMHNFDDPSCFRRNTDATNSPTNAEYAGLLYRWATDPYRLYRGQIAFGEYYNVSTYRSLPICFMHTMAHDIPYYYKVGARYFDYHHVTTGNWGNKALTNYQMARQLWDVRTDCPTMWNDYFAGRYGPAAGVMRDFYESLERMFANVSELTIRLSRRLRDGEDPLFASTHLHYQPEPGVVANGFALTEIVGYSADCRKLIDEAMKMELPPRIKARIAEDQRMFTYGERTVAYLHECVQAFQLGRTGRRDDARRHYAEAARIAELLRADTTSTALSSSHANAPNALLGTPAAGAMRRLEKLLGPL